MSFGTTGNESFDMVIKRGLLAKANPRAWHSSLDIPGGALICREETAWGSQCPMVTYLVSILSSQSQGRYPSLLTGVVWIHRSMVPCPWTDWLGRPKAFCMGSCANNEKTIQVLIKYEALGQPGSTPVVVSSEPWLSQLLLCSLHRGVVTQGKGQTLANS